MAGRCRLSALPAFRNARSRISPPWIRVDRTGLTAPETSRLPWPAVLNVNGLGTSLPPARIFWHAMSPSTLNDSLADLAPRTTSFGIGPKVREPPVQLFLELVGGTASGTAATLSHMSSTNRDTLGDGQLKDLGHRKGFHEGKATTRLSARKRPGGTQGTGPRWFLKLPGAV